MDSVNSRKVFRRILFGKYSKKNDPELISKWIRREE